jgi:cobalt-zinc-cadmium efflux system protein
MHQHHEHHGEHHHHALPLEGVNKAFLLGISLNIAFVVMEVMAGLYYESLALLSDAGHNLSDVAGLLLAWLAFGLSRRNNNQRFTYGYGKTTILAALTNGLMLFLAIGAILWEGILRLWTPQLPQGDKIAMVAGIGIVINALTAWLFLDNKEKDLNIKGAYLHMAADALVSLGVALGGLLIWWTNQWWIDIVLSILVVAVILPSTWRLLVEAWRLSLDGLPPKVNYEAIRTALEALPKVKEAHHIHIWAISTLQNAMTLHLVVEDEATWEEMQAVKREAKHLLLHENIHHATIELEKFADHCEEPYCSPLEEMNHHHHHGHHHH